MAVGRAWLWDNCNCFEMQIFFGRDRFSPGPQTLLKLLFLRKQRDDCNGLMLWRRFLREILAQSLHPLHCGAQEQRCWWRRAEGIPVHVTAAVSVHCPPGLAGEDVLPHLPA